MGVDLATYRARIGTFISPRKCGSEKHSSANGNRKWRGKEVCKVGSYRKNIKCTFNDVCVKIRFVFDFVCI